MSINLASRFRSYFQRAMKVTSIARFSSEEYWTKRYAAGGNSGAGSYSHFAEFKADVLNRFVAEHAVQSVIEFGCGDGNQLKLANYPSYEGYDVSPTAIDICTKLFHSDQSKQFRLLSAYKGGKADMSISLDVIYHLVENDIFEQYMRRLFSSSLRYVAIYSSDTNDTPTNYPSHIKHRKFSDWVSANCPEWKLIGKIANKYPDNGDHTQTTFADFYFYTRH